MAPRHQPRVIAIGSQKGGVAKTTNCVHLAAALGERGRRCLIWDLDMNHGATLHLGVAKDAFLGSFEILSGAEDIRDVIIRDRDEGIELPANVDLITADRRLARIDHMPLARSRDLLLEPLAALNDYDYILLDTAPNLTLPTIAAYRAADWFVLSAIPEPFAVAGLTNAVQDIQLARSHAGSRVRLLGVVVSCCDKRVKTARAVLADIERTFTLQDGTELVFATTISRSAALPQAQQSGKTLFQTQLGHRVTQQYRKLARELETRLQRAD